MALGVWTLGVVERGWPSLARAGSFGFLADPEFLVVTFGVIPAIISELRTVFLPEVVGLSFIPVLHETAKTTRHEILPQSCAVSAFLESEWQICFVYDMIPRHDMSESP